MRIDCIRETKQEEVHQTRDVSFTTLGLNDLDQLVVGRWVELNQNLTDNANTWLLSIVHHRQTIKQLNGALALLVKFLARNSIDLGTRISHELVIQLICRALDSLVWTYAIQ